MSPRAPPSRATKGKGTAESSNTGKRTLLESQSYETYVSEEAEQRAEHFGHSAPLMEREVRLNELEFSTIPNMIKEKGWTKLCAKPHKVYTAVVREFMCNFNADILNGDSDHYMQTYVRGVWVPFSPQIIQEYYNIEEGSAPPPITNFVEVAQFIFPANQQNTWPLNNMVNHGEMTTEMRFLHQFLSTNVLPTTHTTHIHFPKMTLLYRLATGWDVNFGEVIFYNVKDAALTPRSRTKLIMPSLISALYKRAGVPMLPSEAEKKPAPVLRLATMRKSAAQVIRHQNARRENILEDEEDEEDDEGEDEADAGDRRRRNANIPVQEDVPVDRPSSAFPHRLGNRGGVNFGPVLRQMQVSLQHQEEAIGQLQEGQTQLQEGQDMIFATLQSLEDRQCRDHEEMIQMLRRFQWPQDPQPPLEF